MRSKPASLWSNFRTLTILTIFLIAANGASAAERRVALTFAPGFLTAQGTFVYAFGAEAEWYNRGRVSLRGDLYALAAKSKPGVLQQNYQAMLGIMYNFDRSGPVAPFVGFQPGFGFASVTNGVANGLYLYPVLSPVAGLQLYFHERWHVTAHLRYVFGELSYTDTGSVYLSEFRSGLGLGYSF